MCPLNAKTVDDTAGKHIAHLQERRDVSDREKRAIRKLHEKMARTAAGKARK